MGWNHKNKGSDKVHNIDVRPSKNLQIGISEAVVKDSVVATKQHH